MASEFTGLLGTFGLPDLTVNELSQKRRAALREQELAGVDQRFAGSNQAVSQAARIGSILGGTGRDTVSDDEEKRLNAVQTAQQRFKEASERNPALNALDGQKKQNIFQKILADELAGQGEIALGLEIGANLEQKRNAQQLQREELKQAGIATERGQTAAELDANELIANRRGKITTVFPKGSTDPNDGLTAFIQNDGTAVAADGNPIPLGDYTILRPQGLGKDGKFRDRITPSEAAKVRAQQRAISQQMKAGLQMKSALQEAITSDGKVNIMDGAGALTTGTVKVLDGLRAIASQIGGAVDVIDENGRSQGRLDSGPAASRYAKDNFDELDSRLSELTPANIRGNARAREKFYSALIQMTYAQARAQEPGARQLSDADFKNALAGLAGSTSDPESLREVLMGSIDRNFSDFDLWRKQLGPEVYRKVVGESADDTFNADLATFREQFGTDFGSAQNPGAGLTEQVIPDQRVGGGQPFEIIPPGQPGSSIQVGGATIEFE